MLNEFLANNCHRFNGKGEEEEKKGGEKAKSERQWKGADDRQLWSISIFNVDGSFCPRNWKFGLRCRYVGRALIDEAWFRREIREATPCVDQRSLSRHAARKKLADHATFHEKPKSSVEREPTTPNGRKNMAVRPEKMADLPIKRFASSRSPLTYFPLAWVCVRLSTLF